MKIRLKVSVKVRGGQVFIPGVYDSENEGFKDLFNTLTGNESSDVVEVIDAPVPVEVDLDEESEEDSDEEDSSEEESVEESEEVEEKPKKKKKKKKVS